MKKLLHLLIILSLLITGNWLPVTAVEIHPNAGTTSATFLKYGIGSRATAMGNSFAGLADDASAIYWNPAGLVQLDKQEIHVTHNESFESIKHDFAGFVYPHKLGVFGGALYGLYTPEDIEKRSGLNESDPLEPVTPVEGYFRAYDMALHLTYSRWLMKNLSVGTGLKFIQQTIDDTSASGVGLDLAGLYHFNNLPLSVGLILQHIGTPIKFVNESYDQPFNIKAGAAYKWSKKLTTTLDLNKPIDNFLFISAGCEYKVIKYLDLRAGYKYRLNGQELEGLAGISAGIGFNYDINDLTMKLDYAFLPFGVLGNSHRISFGILFGNITRHDYKKPEPKKEIKKEEPKLEEKAKIIDPYNYHKIDIGRKLELATGRMAVFAFWGKTENCDIISFEGKSRSVIKMDALVYEIGEKFGSDNVYKEFIFKSNQNVKVQNALIKIRLPNNITDPVIKTMNGEIVIKPTKINEDEMFIYYEFNMEQLSNFTIEGN